MGKSPNPPATAQEDDPAQSQRFIDMAKEVEADPDQEKFDKKVLSIISSKHKNLTIKGNEN